MNIKIREARPEDAALLAELNAAVQRHHAEAKAEQYKMPIPNDPALIAIYEGHLQTAEAFLYIAEADNEPVAYILCKINEREENPFTIAFKTLIVDQVSVNASHRGRGIGEMLMNRAYELAKEQQVHTISLGVHAFNEDAIRFYKRLGFEVSSLRMSKML